MRRLMLLALPLALAACGGSDNSSTGPTLASVAGTWNLSTVNGAPLPYTISNNGGLKTEVLSAVTIVTANGTFNEVQQIRTTFNGQATVTSLPTSGTFSLSGTLVTLNITGSGTLSGTLTNSTTFAVTDPTGAIYVFVKQ